MIIHTIIILIYLIKLNEILDRIINSIIIKFDIVLYNENDIKKEISKNYNKYRNLINAKKKNEQRLNINKKI